MVQDNDRAPSYRSHYIPNTDQDRREMLKAVGVDTAEELFFDIPEEYRNPPLDLPGPLSELELKQDLKTLAAQNLHLDGRSSFLGAGAYNHFSPSIVRALITRGEFLTAYTPYQPEASQGTLQAAYDFQTLVCNLMGMEVADAGMYDGASSLAEAALMACRVTGRDHVSVLDSVSPFYRQVLETYIKPQGIGLHLIASGDADLPQDSACLIVQYPNFFGYVEDLAKQERAAHDGGALFVVAANPIAMGMFRPPGDYNADIVIGEGQALGIPISYGGPYVGLFTTKQEYVRQMPGRIAGKTVDDQGRTGYVLTLSTREQHIRREKATSNICTNQALMSLAATVYMSALGKHGLRKVAELCYHKAHYAASTIGQLNGYTFPFEGVFFHEFVVRCPRPPAEINERLMEEGIIGGLDISDITPNGMLLCATEVNTREEIDSLVSVLAEFATP